MYEELRTDDFRAVYRLLGECTELWVDPAAWQDHLLAGVSRVIHLPVGLHAELDYFASSRTTQIIQGREHGWADTAAQLQFAKAMRQNGPFTTAPFDARFRRLVCEHGDLTLSRAEVVPDREWHRSETFNTAHHPAQMDEILYSAIRSGPRGRVHLLAFGGPKHRPTKRECEFVDFLHRELVPLRRSRLARETDHSLHGLSPRRREILALVTEGLPEKLIADRLGLRPSSVNEHMQELYAHFGVHSRARLMAYLLKRMPLPRRN
jgi:DNA-binding CsgD family transcriptional regulator